MWLSFSLWFSGGSESLFLAPLFLLRSCSSKSLTEKGSMWEVPPPHGSLWAHRLFLCSFISPFQSSSGLFLFLFLLLSLCLCPVIIHIVNRRFLLFCYNYWKRFYASCLWLKRLLREQHYIPLVESGKEKVVCLFVFICR